MSLFAFDGEGLREIQKHNLTVTAAPRRDDADALSEVAILLSLRPGRYHAVRNRYDSRLSFLMTRMRLRSLSPGEYLLWFVAESAGSRATREVRFSIR